MSVKNILKPVIGIIVILFASCPLTFGENSQDSLKLVPDQIDIGTFYHGVDMQVSAEINSCDNAVIVLEGSDKEVTLNRKGRVAIIWMNVAQLTITGMPEVYILAATDKLDNICSEEIRTKLRLGEESLRSLMKVESDKPLTGKEFEEFLKLKTHNGTYDSGIEISLEDIAPGRQKLTSILPIPSQMPPGEYEVKLYCFRQGELSESMSGHLGIKRVGLPEMMIQLADNHAPMYGLLAIVIAMVVGIVMGFIFNSLPGKEH